VGADPHMTPGPAVASWALSERANLALACVHQHRLLSTAQLHQLVAPQTGRRKVQALLAGLADRGLLARVRERTGARGAMSLWHLTATGAGVVLAAPAIAEPRRRVLSAEQAAGLLQQHTLAVNEVGLAFVRAARARGDDCGPLAWRHEIAHPAGPKRGDLVIADALLSYLTATPAGGPPLQQRFIELDRATVPADALATKLARYAALARHRRPGATAPAWREHYPALPAVLVVLTGTPTARLERRMRAVVGLSRAHQQLAAARELRIYLCLLDDLQAAGPFATIFRPLDAPEAPTDWLGSKPRAATR
jgi:protein involved in plasmid replication-relaxation